MRQSPSVVDYRTHNRSSWDERAPAHAASPDYAVERFLEDPRFISGVVRFDLPLLGDVEGLHGVHLQCHIGTDTVSLSRLGARMSGLDFSPPALEQATVEGSSAFHREAHRREAAFLEAVQYLQCGVGRKLRGPIHEAGAKCRVVAVRD